MTPDREMTSLTIPLDKKDLIRRAYKIASDLEKGDYSGIDASMILAMALGVFMEGQPDSHRNLEPLIDAMLEAAQTAFDALRESRLRDEGKPQ